MDEIYSSRELPPDHIIEWQGHPGALSPRPEVPEFTHAMSNPTYIDVEGIRYGVFKLHEDTAAAEEGSRPLVVNFAHGEEASRGAGRFDLNAFSQTLPSSRPIIAIDMAGMGESKYKVSGQLWHNTFATLAANHLEILNSLGVDTFDVVGNSMGSIMGTEIAALAGDRARHLVTFSAPAHEDTIRTRDALRAHRQNTKDFRIARETVPPEIRGEIEAARAHRRQDPGSRRVQMAGSLLRYAVLLLEPTMKESLDRLDPATQWTDIAARNDAFSDWALHYRAVEKRNELNPGSSSIYVVNEGTHAWQAYYRWEVAAITAQILQDENKTP